MAFKMAGFSAFTKQTMQGKPSHEDDKKSKLLPSEDPATELTTENDRIQEQIVNLEQRIEFIGEDINSSGNKVTKQQRNDLSNLRKQLAALRKQQK
tara:strand:+ start:7 stop:294 length:288 start_codon:yes stop_codon:yes gene_type:complete